MQFRIVKTALFFLSICCLSLGCKKGWLDAKPVQSLVVPTTLKDLQAFLDNSARLNTDQGTLGEYSTTDYYVDNIALANVTAPERNAYTWASNVDFYENVELSDWRRCYEAVFYANTVLENVGKITPDEGTYSTWANIKGSALFHRAYLFFNLAQLFCKPYIPSSASTDLGIILRLEPDVAMPSFRSTVKQTYDQIIKDLLEAKSLLVDNISQYKTRPSKLAAYAMLARAYLAMQDYTAAGQYADSCLSVSRVLINYAAGTADPSIADTTSTTANPFTFKGPYNAETIFFTRMQPSRLLPIPSPGQGLVDSTLLASYAVNDRRRTLFFKTVSGRIAMYGNYTATIVPFNGLATDEVYLTRAECHVRNGNVSAGLVVLDSLLVKRFRTGTYTPLSVLPLPSAEDALRIIFLERRKELCFRAIRWTDLRRLNQDPRFAVTLTRGIKGTSTLFTLPPNDNRYVFPIPNSEILFSGVPQNPR